MRLEGIIKELVIQAQQGHDATPPTATSASVGFFDQASGVRISTETYMLNALRNEFTHMEITCLAPSPSNSRPALLAFADATDEASYELVDNNDRSSFSHPYTCKRYMPPARRIDGPATGQVVDEIKFAKYRYTYQQQSHLLYVFDSRDGNGYYPTLTSQLLVHTPQDSTRSHIKELIKSAGKWAAELHGEIWVFDRSFWQKDAVLYASMAKANWKDVILDEREKRDIQSDVRRFFDGRDRYEKLRVPWKRGVIYHGPPGNGKTISIKALMHELYSRKDPIPSLYVKSLTSPFGPEFSVKQVFAKARAEAPCLLIFEDLDSLVTDEVRSYFLNEVDGLATNEGVMMIGSTNHLDRLDPGLSKRPSRFDRKFNFPKPNMEQRVAYCEYWRGKLKDNKELEFPQDLCHAIAEITDDFSFAYMQEAFVAALLALAFEGDDDQRDDDSICCDQCGKRGGGDRYKDLPLWKEIKKQVKTLREEL